MGRYLSSIILLMVPAIIALGHDLFVNIYVENLQYGFRMSDYGYLVQTYNPQWHAQIWYYTPADYKDFITWVLEQKAVIVGILYGVIMPFVLGAQYFILNIFFGNPSRFAHNIHGHDHDLPGQKKPMKFKYKRR